MAKQNKEVMSVAIHPEVRQKLKECAKIRGLSASAYVQTLIEKALEIDEDKEPVIVGKPVDGSVDIVVLQVPVSLKGDENALNAWMETQRARIVKRLAP